MILLVVFPITEAVFPDVLNITMRSEDEHRTTDGWLFVQASPRSTEYIHITLHV